MANQSVKVTRRPQPQIQHALYPVDLQSTLVTLLSPITSTLNVLNETVVALVHAWKERDDHDAAIRNNAIESEVLAADIHRLAKNYPLLKEQLQLSQQTLVAISDRMSKMEKLMETFVKRQNISLNRTQKTEAVPASVVTMTTAPVYSVDISRMKISSTYAEHDFPKGSWLGDPMAPKSRVRCPVTPSDLTFINAKCATPEKMALTLLDYLFEKETLSVSNISGRSKLGKKQLDPVLINGIQCHLMYMFGIDEEQWERIKLSIDSKCRKAWKKRRLEQDTECCVVELEQDECLSSDQLDVREEGGEGGSDSDVTMPRVFRAIRGRSVKAEQEESSVHLDVAEEDGRGESDSDVTMRRIFRAVHGRGNVQVLEADQILHYPDGTNVQILDGDHILPVMSSDGEDCENVTLTRREHDVALGSADTVSFVLEPIMEVLTENELREDDSELAL